MVEKLRKRLNNLLVLLELPFNLSFNRIRNNDLLSFPKNLKSRNGFLISLVNILLLLHKLVIYLDPAVVAHEVVLNFLLEQLHFGPVGFDRHSLIKLPDAFLHRLMGVHKLIYFPSEIYDLRHEHSGDHIDVLNLRKYVKSSEKPFEVTLGLVDVLNLIELIHNCFNLQVFLLELLLILKKLFGHVLV